MNLKQRILFPLVFIMTAGLASAFASPKNTYDVFKEIPFDEAQVFEWWDDGLISGEEASELLDKLQEANIEEACHLATALALETCEVPKSPANKQKSREEEGLAPHGYVVYKTRIDSLGDAENTVLNLKVKFYRFDLQLGTRELFSYRHKGAEAHFGQISTREFHSQIATDTLWGTALYVPLGKWRFQGVLDTALHLQGAAEFQQRGFSAGAFFWHRLEQESSLGVQLKVPAGEIAGWWQQGQNAPLVRLRIHQETSRKDSLQFSWQTTAYFHGKDIPEQANLSSTLLKNKFTGTQSVTVTFPPEYVPSFFPGRDSWTTKLSANARVFIPVDSDSLKAKLKIAAESGPDPLRGNLSATCQETANHCRQKDIQFKLTSSFIPEVTLGTSVKSRHTREEGFSAPKTEASLAYQPDKQFSSRISVSFPQGMPQKKTQIRSETALKTEHFQSSLVVTFRRIQGENFHPVHGLLQVKWLF